MTAQAGAARAGEGGGPMGDDGGFERDLEAISRHYTERFLPANPWASLLNAHPYLVARQRQRRVREALVECGVRTPEALRGMSVLDVGCGSGSNLAWLVELGADPSRLTGIDLVAQRTELARSRFAGIRFVAGDFLQADVGGPFDMVMMFAVLSSVTNAELKRGLMDKALRLLRPGGIFFFYDVVSRRPIPGTAAYQRLTFAELEGYFAPRPLRVFRRDILRREVADRLVQRFGVTVAELVQATGLLNIDGTFAYARG
ncbi:class I SAM-dependent methyltransferase [Sorangium sp. So ce296]|uniref:class I SAM-dependent methyltransferase n=1 Tax=Sorangium sp. So ce296 TaxID=3133296 RepID=UPI003F62C131